jgi:YHS domain-containing protein
VRKSAIVFVLITVASLAAAQAAPQKRLVNTDRQALALKGHDPVAFFTEGRPVAGDPRFESNHIGVRYRFASAENKQAFDADPAQYEPQFGGFCAYAVSRGYTADIDPEAFQIVDGRLLMQYSKRARDLFNQDTLGNLKKADQNWPGLVAKEGR